MFRAYFFEKNITGTDIPMDQILLVKKSKGGTEVANGRSSLNFTHGVPRKRILDVVAKVPAGIVGVKNGGRDSRMVKRTSDWFNDVFM